MPSLFIPNVHKQATFFSLSSSHPNLRCRSRGSLMQTCTSDPSRRLYPSFNITTAFPSRVHAFPTPSSSRTILSSRLLHWVNCSYYTRASFTHCSLLRSRSRLPLRRRSVRMSSLTNLATSGRTQSADLFPTRCAVERSSFIWLKRRNLPRLHMAETHIDFVDNFKRTVQTSS